MLLVKSPRCKYFLPSIKIYLHPPWITTTTKRLLRKKQRWYAKFRHSQSERVKNKYLEVKRECQRECRKAYSQYVGNLVSEEGCTKKLWSYIKRKSTEKIGIPDLVSADKIISSPLEKANLLNDQFSSVFSVPDSLSPDPSHGEIPPPNIPCFGHIEVSRAGVLKLLKGIKEHKATGPDEIPGKLLKLCAEDLVDSLTFLFQASLDQGTIPDDWKKAKIVPVFKKGDKGKAENYRPISLTSIICKML